MLGANGCGIAQCAKKQRLQGLKNVNRTMSRIVFPGKSLKQKEQYGVVHATNGCLSAKHSRKCIVIARAAMIPGQDGIAILAVLIMFEEVGKVTPIHFVLLN